MDEIRYFLKFIEENKQDLANLYTFLLMPLLTVCLSMTGWLIGIKISKNQFEFNRMLKGKEIQVNVVNQLLDEIRDINVNITRYFSTFLSGIDALLGVCEIGFSNDEGGRLLAEDLWKYTGDVNKAYIDLSKSITNLYSRYLSRWIVFQNYNEDMEKVIEFHRKLINIYDIYKKSNFILKDLRTDNTKNREYNLSIVNDAIEIFNTDIIPILNNLDYTLTNMQLKMQVEFFKDLINKELPNITKKIDKLKPIELKK